MVLIGKRQQQALGFNERKIKIMEVDLTKERHIRTFLENLLSRISEHDKQTLLRQLESRVDKNANFFVRLEKESLAKQGGLLVTDSGNCYHVKIKIAAYPSTKDNAVKLIKSFWQQFRS